MKERCKRRGTLQYPKHNLQARQNLMLLLRNTAFLGYFFCFVFFFNFFFFYLTKKPTKFFFFIPKHWNRAVKNFSNFLFFFCWISKLQQRIKKKKKKQQDCVATLCRSFQIIIIIHSISFSSLSTAGKKRNSNYVITIWDFFSLSFLFSKILVFSPSSIRPCDQWV